MPHAAKIFEALGRIWMPAPIYPISVVERLGGRGGHEEREKIYFSDPTSSL